jgi:type IV pilus assembly protein PilC
MLADYFQRQNQVWSRLKSMMTYPLIVLVVALLISVLISSAWVWAIGPSFKEIFSGMGIRLPAFTLFVFATLDSIWAFPAVIFLILLAVLSVLFVQPIREKVMWRLPAFKETIISRIASSIHLLVSHGVALPEAIGLTEQLETTPQAAADLQNWKSRLAGGAVKFSEVAAGNQLIPPMFTWLVSGAGENLAEGFKRAAEIYHSRAIYRTEVALYTVLPLASLFLGAVVISQAFLVISMFLPMIAMLNNLSGNG